MGVAQVRSRQVEQEARQPHTEDVEGGKVAAKEPDGGAADKPKHRQTARKIEHMLDRVNAKQREWRQHSGAVVDLVKAPKRC